MAGAAEFRCRLKELNTKPVRSDSLLHCCYNVVKFSIEDCMNA